MTLRPAELVAVADDLSRRLPGSPLQKVVAAGDDAYAFGFRGTWMLLSTRDRVGRVHLVDEKPPGTGEPARAFLMLLRRELIGLRFEAIETVAGERVVALALSRGAVRRRLLAWFYGSGPRLVLLDENHAVLGAASPLAHGITPRVALPPPRADDRPARFTGPAPSLEIAAWYAEAEAGTSRLAALSAASRGARRALEKVARREAALVRDLARIVDAGARRHHADLLLAHAHEVGRGAREVVLANDFTDGEPITIALDPALDVVRNAAKIYAEAKRRARGRALVEARLAEARAELIRLRARLEAVDAGDAMAIADVALGGAARPPRTEPRRGAAAGSSAPARSRPFRRFRSVTGRAILVGRGAARNDELTFRVAAGNDLWMHARDLPGAHVVVPLAGAPVDEATLIDAATLTLWFSAARPDAAAGDDVLRKMQADVTYVQRKHVRKPKGAGPGRVSVAGGKTLRVRLEPERLRRLLASQEDEPARPG